MTLTIAEWLANLLTGYAVVGAVFAVAFVTVGIRAVDPVAKGSGAGFRLIISPGVAALWPLLLTRWVGKRAGSPGGSK
jgi:hypothetical protein